MGLYLSLYGGLLTERQRHAMDLHYSFDLSLAEIAEEMRISRQGVHDLIHRSEQQLSQLEEAVRMGAILRRMEPMIESARGIAEAIEDPAKRDQLNDMLSRMRDILTESGE